MAYIDLILFRNGFDNSGMTDDSKFVLRWEIDDAVAKFGTGKVQSEVFDKGGFEW